jgi:WD40 repeat protein
MVYQLFLSFQGHSRPINCAVFSQDGQFLATGGTLLGHCGHV